MNTKELNIVLVEHSLWLIGEGGQRAFLQGANLRGANLQDANLQDANLHDTNLRGANLRGANLQRADLQRADLYDTNLQRADLRGANLYYTNLRGANLRDANLQDANLHDTNLRGANLRGANLYDTNLRGANLRGVNLRGANLRGANLRGANLLPIVEAQTLITPEGTIIGYKKAGTCIVKLSIPVNSPRHNATGRKCRCEYADVLSITSLDTNTEREQVFSSWDTCFEYIVGERATATSYNSDRFDECAGGIHFFLTRIEAEDY